MAGDVSVTRVVRDGETQGIQIYSGEDENRSSILLKFDENTLSFNIENNQNLTETQVLDLVNRGVDGLEPYATPLLVDAIRGINGDTDVTMQDLIDVRETLRENILSNSDNPATQRLATELADEFANGQVLEKLEESTLLGLVTLKDGLTDLELRSYQVNTTGQRATDAAIIKDAIALNAEGKGYAVEPNVDTENTNTQELPLATGNDIPQVADGAPIDTPVVTSAENAPLVFSADAKSTQLKMNARGYGATGADGLVADRTKTDVMAYDTDNESVDLSEFDLNTQDGLKDALKVIDQDITNNMKDPAYVAEMRDGLNRVAAEQNLDLSEIKGFKVGDKEISMAAVADDTLTVAALDQDSSLGGAEVVSVNKISNQFNLHAGNTVDLSIDNVQSQNVELAQAPMPKLANVTLDRANDAIGAGLATLDIKNNGKISLVEVNPADDLDVSVSRLDTGDFNDAQLGAMNFSDDNMVAFGNALEIAEQSGIMQTSENGIILKTDDFDVSVRRNEAGEVEAQLVTESMRNNPETAFVLKQAQEQTPAAFAKADMNDFEIGTKDAGKLTSDVFAEAKEINNTVPTIIDAPIEDSLRTQTGVSGFTLPTNG